MELLRKLGQKKEAFRKWKQGRVSREEHREIVWDVRDNVREVMAHFEESGQGCQG